MPNTQVNLNGYMMKIRDNGDGTYSTTTGKTTQSLQSHNAVAIRDTANNDSALIDVSSFENKSVFVYNGLNQALSAQLMVYNPDGTLLYLVPGAKTIATGSAYLISAADYALLSAPFMKMKVRLFCTVAPTSGITSSWVMGY